MRLPLLGKKKLFIGPDECVSSQCSYGSNKVPSLNKSFSKKRPDCNCVLQRPQNVPSLHLVGGRSGSTRLGGLGGVMLHFRPRSLSHRAGLLIPGSSQLSGQHFWSALVSQL